MTNQVVGKWRALLLALLLSGCFGGVGTLIRSPLTYSQMQTELDQLVPRGTPREEALSKLKEAGIETSEGTNQSLYYADVWNRPDGERWFVNVALLFDAQGRLYEMRPGQAEVDVVRPGSTADASPAQSAP